MSDVNDDPVRRDPTSDETGMSELRPIFRKFLAEVNQAGSSDGVHTYALMNLTAYRLANLADDRIRTVFGSRLAAPNVDVVFSPELIVTAFEGLRKVPRGVFENATTTVPLPADTIRAGEIRQSDINYVAALLLAVIAWLLTFVGPVMISKLPQADQSTVTDYYSGIPGLALMLTGYLITHRSKGK